MAHDEPHLSYVKPGKYKRTGDDHVPPLAGRNRRGAGSTFQPDLTQTLSGPRLEDLPGTPIRVEDEDRPLATLSRQGSQTPRSVTGQELTMSALDRQEQQR